MRRSRIALGFAVLGGIAARTASADLEGFVESGDRVSGDLRSGGETDTYRLQGLGGDVLEAAVRANRSVTVKLLDSNGNVMTQQTGRNVHIVANALVSAGQVSVQIVGGTTPGKARYTATLTCGDETGDRRLDLREATIGARTTSVEADFVAGAGDELVAEHVQGIDGARAFFASVPHRGKAFLIGATADLQPNGLTSVGPAVLFGPLPNSFANTIVEVTLPYDPSQVSLAPQVLVAGLDGRTSVVKNVTIDAANSVVRFYARKTGVFQVFDGTSTIDPISGTALATSDAADLDQMSAVAISNGRMVVGVKSHVEVVGGQTKNFGAAYVFELGTGGWTEVAKLQPADLTGVGGFGSAVAIDGDRIMVGKPITSTFPSVYVFDRVGGVWTETAAIAAGFNEVMFGADLALQADRVLIGDPSYQGGAHVYDFDGTDWVGDPRITSGVSGFGTSVALDGDRILVGAPQTGIPGARGLAYTYVKVSGVWLQEAEIRPAEGSTADQFGTDVALEDSTAVIGAWYASSVSGARGAAYVYERTAGLWAQKARIENPNGNASDRFGISVALSGGRLLIGAPMANTIATEGGMAYLVKKTGSNWGAPKEIVPSGIGIGDHVGQFLALSGAVSAVAAPGDDDGASNAGVVHILDLTGR